MGNLNPWTIRTKRVLRRTKNASAAFSVKGSKEKYLLPWEIRRNHNYLLNSKANALGLLNLPLVPSAPEVIEDHINDVEPPLLEDENLQDHMNDVEDEEPPHLEDEIIPEKSGNILNEKRARSPMWRRTSHLILGTRHFLSSC